jgi:hypothetical protein
MSITAMAGRLISVIRRTAFIHDPQALSNLTVNIGPTRQPVVDGFVEVEVTGKGPFGTLNVVGDVGGIPLPELLTFTGAGTQVTANRYDAGSIQYITSTGWSSFASFSSRSVGADGSRLHIPYTVITGVRAHLNRGAARWPATAAGVAEVERTWFGIDYTTAWAPREGDVFVDENSGEQWRVVGTPDWLGGLRPHHWEVRVERNEGSLNV